MTAARSSAVIYVPRDRQFAARWWQWMLIAAATVMLCSCRALPDGGTDLNQPPMAATPAPVVRSVPWQAASGMAAAGMAASGENIAPLNAGHGAPPSARQAVAPAGHDITLPPQAFSGHPLDGYTRPGWVDEGLSAEDVGLAAPYGCPHCVPSAGGGYGFPAAPWRPPGIAGPWPRDEYVCDGGDADPAVMIGKDWSVRGLNVDDAVAHYDTLSGRLVVEPSNRVCLYAPRFAAVRKVFGVSAHEQHDRSIDVDRPTRLVQGEFSQLATTAIQPLQPVGQVGRRQVTIYRDRLMGVGVDNAQRLTEFATAFLPYEDFQVIRAGQFQQSEKARLAESSEAALVWTHDQAVQVIVDGQAAVVESHDTAPQETVVAELAGKPRKRVTKDSSRRDARPGDIVEFTLRFDNTGSQPVGNVTILDNLSPRLELVPDSAQCSLEARFFTQENEAGSLVLRWEITAAVNAGQGGIIRFQCRVR
jgi:uncharacterized repeat protein (TIGR01451 family)